MNLRIKLVKTKRTDVLCTSCGSFQADHVIVRTDGTETDCGIHTKCVGTEAVKFTRKKKEPEAASKLVIERGVLVRLRSGT